MGQCSAACARPELPGFGEDGCDARLHFPAKVWEGWGCSLAWCGKAMGASKNAAAWADLFFSMKDLSMEQIWSEQPADLTIPCLGLNIARYNVGGVGGQPGEKTSRKSRGWYAEIEGFQPCEGGAFDWSRDSEQRIFLTLAVESGVDMVELFSNAPMWWMMDSTSSFGGSVAKPDEFATYLASVAQHAANEWRLPIVSVAPFNEPNAGWWRYPHDQEGCNIPMKKQSGIITKLREELDSRELQDIIIAVSDENTPQAALKSWKHLRATDVKAVAKRINFHGYDGLKPWKESNHPGIRASLCRQAAEEDGLSLWMNEYGNASTDGLDLAQSILEDVHFSKVTAWCYWQVLEHKCSWGLIECDFKPGGVENVQKPHPKYFVFAHFTRFLRPGAEILHCSQPFALAGYAAKTQSLTIVLVNLSAACTKSVRLDEFATSGQTATAYITQPRANSFMSPATADVVDEADGGLQISVEMPALSVCSVVLTAVKK